MIQFGEINVSDLGTMFKKYMLPYDNAVVEVHAMTDKAPNRVLIVQDGARKELWYDVHRNSPSPNELVQAAVNAVTLFRNTSN